MSSHPPQGQSNGPPSAGMGMQHQSGGQGSSQQGQNMSSQNLNQIVRIVFSRKATVICIQSFHGMKVCHPSRHRVHLLIFPGYGYLTSYSCPENCLRPSSEAVVVVTSVKVHLLS